MGDFGHEDCGMDCDSGRLRRGGRMVAWSAHTTGLREKHVHNTRAQSTTHAHNTPGLAHASNITRTAQRAAHARTAHAHNTRAHSTRAHRAHVRTTHAHRSILQAWQNTRAQLTRAEHNTRPQHTGPSSSAHSTRAYTRARHMRTEHMEHTAHARYNTRALRGAQHSTRHACTARRT